MARTPSRIGAPLRSARKRCGKAVMGRKTGWWRK
jgi:hypothetical protein